VCSGRAVDKREAPGGGIGGERKTCAAGGVAVVPVTPPAAPSPGAGIRRHGWGFAEGQI